MILRLRTIVPALLCLLTMLSVLSDARGTLDGKKIIEYGVSAPDAADVRVKWKKMDELPVDGVVIRIMAPGTAEYGQSSLGWKVFSKVKFKPEEYEQAITDLQTAKFTRLKDNFVQVISMPGDVDWFDPDWSAVAHNAACLARVAKQGGCKGIAFDAEDYGKYHIWSYNHLPAEWRSAHSYEEYAAKVKERGKEFIRAINREYPDITILCFFGPSWTYTTANGRSLDKVGYGLLISFFDGICEAATPGTIVVDGFEQSYGYRDRESFRKGREIMLRDTKSISTCPDAFKKHVRAGFGIWVDNGSNARPELWNEQDFSKNYFTPEQFRASVSYALEVSDKYIWVYSEKMNWWDPKSPAAYKDALRLAKTGSGTDD